jgi:hypothetical protein
LIFGPGTSSLPFTLNVPVSTTGFDLFATSLDAYAAPDCTTGSGSCGITEPNTGHTFGVWSDVASPAACVNSASGATLTLDCVGHGSVAGSVTNPDPTTQLVLSKAASNNGSQVAVQSTNEGLFSANTTENNTAYTMCAPPDSYTFSEERVPGTPMPTPAPGGTAGPSPAPTTVGSQSVMIPAPAATSSPCPSTCFSAINNGTCPGVCAGTTANF